MDKISVVIQAGGASRRMGGDKGLVPFAGKTMVEFILEQVSSLGDEMFLVSNHPKVYERLGFPVFTDVIEGIGALGGVYSALYHAKYDRCLLLAVDMPFIIPALIQYIIAESEGYDVTVPRLQHGYIEPFRAVYHKKCMPSIEAVINSGQRKVIAFYDLVRVRYIEGNELLQFDPKLRTFFNVNTPQELQEARKVAANQGE
jgi:molybdopterin-guanine dinucleotide biosynthesis protein A